MSKEILYYPTIEFQEYDYNWLWMASLLWDKVYRIVPDGYILHEPRNIQEICSTGDIGISLSPNIYSKDASAKFIKNLDEGIWQAAALDFNHSDIEKYDNYCKLHKDKVDVTLRNLMLLNESNLEDDDWLYVSKDMSNQYMIFLATEIAKKNNLSLCTYDPDVWTASTFFLHSESVQDSFYPGNCYIEESKAALTPIFFNEVFPANLLGIPASKILEFREKRKDERAQFQRAIDDFSKRFASASDPRILEQILNEEKIKVEYALTEYKKSMDIMKVVKWGGYITSLATITTDALGYTSFNSNVIQGLTSAGIGVGLLTGLLEKKINSINTPYSYLSSIKNLSMDYFNEYNSMLYKKVEEFIND